MRNLMLYQPADAHECSYLPERQAQSQYIDPRVSLTEHELTQLSQMGFRRSGRLVYRPNCPQCGACQSVRIRCYDFSLSRSHKRLLNTNRDLQLRITTPSNQSHYYRLFEHYISERHADGDMYPASPEQFREFLTEDFGTTRQLEAWQGDELCACLVFDCLGDGLSSVYCYFDPAQPERSLGRYMILRITQLCQALGLPFHYLGYYVENAPKMAYKRQWQPSERLINGVWCIGNV